MADPVGAETRNTITGGTQQGPVLMADRIHGVHIGDVVQAPAVPVALGQLPALVARFVGRDTEQAEITTVLDPAGDTGVVVVVVSGPPGVGKTELAVKACHAARRAGWFPGGVLFINLHGYDDAPVQPGQALDALLRALGVAAEHIPPTTEERGGLYRSALARISDPVLIVADNVSADAQVRSLLPGPGPHRVVVTSRHTLAGLAARQVEVKVLYEDTAVRLLDLALRDARPGDDRISADRPEARRMAGACDGLPLALQITAALLKADPSREVSDLADELSDEVRRLGALHYDDGSGTRAPSVAAAFELSYRQLDAPTARVFRLLPVNPGPDVSATAAAVLAALPVREAHRVLRQLAAAHLVETAAGAAGRWRMHDLLRLYARQVSEAHADTDAPELARDRLFRYYLAMACAADRHLHALPRGAASGEFTGRAEALDWLDVERPNLLATVTTAARTGPEQVACDLPVALGHYFYLRRRLDDWLLALGISRTVASQMAEREKEARSLTQQGWALTEQRLFDEAIAACDEAVKIVEKSYQLGRAGALTNRGHALRGQHRFEAAIEAYQAAEQAYRKTGDRRGLGIVLTNLGLAQAGLGRPDKAVAAHREAVGLFQAIKDRQEEAAALTNLGHVLRDQGDHDEAIRACQEAVKAYQGNGDGDGDRHGEGNALNELGLALQKAGRTEEAATNHEMALAIFRETRDRFGQGIALSNASPAYVKLRRLGEAVSAGQAAVEIFQEAADSYSEGIALGRLGLALQELGRFDEAIAMHQQNLEVCTKTKDRRGQAEVLVNLGMALQAAQRFDEAIAAYQDAVAAFQETDNHEAEDVALEHLHQARAAIQA